MNREMTDLEWRLSLLRDGAQTPTEFGLAAGKKIYSASAWASPILKRMCEAGFVERTALPSIGAVRRCEYSLTAEGEDRLDVARKVRG